MLRAYKTEVKFTKQQMSKFLQTIGVCRFVYNLYIAENMRRHENNEKFLSGFDFSKWLNNVYIPAHPDAVWIKQVSSKAVKKSIMNAETAYKRFFKSKSGFPKFKKKGLTDPNVYLPRNNKTDWTVERHRIKIPTFGWVQLKEYGYIPTNTNTHIVKSGTLSMRAGRVYVSVLIEEPEPNPILPKHAGIGIDLGIKNLAICSHGTTYQNVNKTKEVRRLERKLKHEQRALSRKYERRKQNKTKGDATRQNIQKNRLRIQRIYQRLYNIRIDWQNKAIAELVKTKPAYITIEDLNVAGMLKNHHLAKAIANQQLSRFRTHLTWKCSIAKIELRIANRWFPSSKTCHCCGYVNKSLKLKDRTFHCPACHTSIDRDFNASLNLKDCTDYKIA